MYRLPPHTHYLDRTGYARISRVVLVETEGVWTPVGAAAPACRMGSHSATYHPAEVTPAFTTAKDGTRFNDPETVQG